MPYKRPITDFKFNMALLLPPPAPAVDVSPQFPVVGSAMDLIWGGGFATNAEKTNVARARQEANQGLSTSMGCMDLAAMARKEPESELGEGLATSTGCWNLAAMAQEEAKSDDEGGGMRSLAGCWDLSAMAQEESGDDWAMDVDEQ